MTRGIKYECKNLPEDLAPGRYTVRIKSGKWTKDGILIELEYVGPEIKGFESLITLVKADNGEGFMETTEKVD